MLAAVTFALALSMVFPAHAAAHDEPCADGHHAPASPEAPPGRATCLGIACTAVMPVLPVPVCRLAAPAVAARAEAAPLAAPAGHEVPPALRPPQPTA